MKSKHTDTHIGATPRFTKLKEMLKRFKLNYEERIEGNTLVIDIKAKPQPHFLPERKAGHGPKLAL